ncbi:uncharacterized protein LOC103708924 [Phoenix dactylifera]|uniref:Uncharacterized protein LOC103708924 n=1 Tax=Phoenix dactylifera TaxID=42345 RepID=A0A8B8J5N8_PHODC|nr:uncharacterized protein LOC103708924 [Phoenix dactylifera]
MADDAVVEKISISGPTLASIIHRFTSSPGDVDGLLFGHVARLPPPDLHDDDPSAATSAAASQSPLSATVTGIFCSGSPMGFYDALGRLDLPALRRAFAAADHRPPGFALLGWFSGRRRSPVHPSMREFAVSFSLSKYPTLTLDDRPGSAHPDLPPKPCIFLLLASSPSPNHAVHTHEYRAFVFRSTAAGSGALEPRSLDVINVGPAFRGQYSSFSPASAFPWMPCWPRGIEEGERERGSKKGESLREAERELRLLESSAEGFGLERLERLVGPGAAEYTSELEDLYTKMLLKLEGLARLVEKSSARVLEQENRNSLLRNKLAGME